MRAVTLPVRLKYTVTESAPQRPRPSSLPLCGLREKQSPAKMTRALDNSADTCGNANAAWRRRESAVVWNCNQTVIGKVENKHPPLPSGSQDPRIQNKAREVQGEITPVQMSEWHPLPPTPWGPLCAIVAAYPTRWRGQAENLDHTGWLVALRLQTGKRDGWVKESRREGLVTAGAACFIGVLFLLHLCCTSEFTGRRTSASLPLTPPKRHTARIKSLAKYGTGQQCHTAQSCNLSHSTLSRSTVL